MTSWKSLVQIQYRPLRRPARQKRPGMSSCRAYFLHGWWPSPPRGRYRARRSATIRFSWDRGVGRSDSRGGLGGCRTSKSRLLRPSGRTRRPIQQVVVDTGPLLDRQQMPGHRGLGFLFRHHFDQVISNVFQRKLGLGVPLALENPVPGLGGRPVLDNCRNLTHPQLESRRLELGELMMATDRWDQTSQ